MLGGLISTKQNDVEPPQLGLHDKRIGAEFFPKKEIHSYIKNIYLSQSENNGSTPLEKEFSETSLLFGWLTALRASWEKDDKKGSNVGHVECSGVSQ